MYYAWDCNQRASPGDAPALVADALTLVATLTFAVTCQGIDGHALGILLLGATDSRA